MKISNKQQEILQNLGLTKNQVVLYVECLGNGMMTALELARATGVNRQQVYEEAEGLVRLGLFDITRKQRKKFIAARPDKLIRLGEERVKRVENILSQVAGLVPSLESLSGGKKSKVVTKYYEGLSRIRDAHKDELNAARATEVLTFVGSLEHTFNYFPESYWAKWNQQFVKQKSKSRMLVHDSQAARESVKYDKKYNRQTRYLDNFPLKLNIDVFGEVILVVSFVDEIVIWVESRVLADSYRVLFETLWGLARKFD